MGAVAAKNRRCGTAYSIISLNGTLMTDIKAFTMPKWGIEMTEGQVAEWKVSEGESFARGTLLALIETDKITNEVEAEADGRFARIIAQTGETYPVGALLAVLANDDVEISRVDAFIASYKSVDRSGIEGTDSTTVLSNTSIEEPGRTLISPMAEKLAGERSLDVSKITGSGRGGRITVQDVEEAIRSSPAAPANTEELDPTQTAVSEYSIIKMSPARKAIARRLSEAKATIPHFYLRRRVVIERLVALRSHRKHPNASINDYLIRASALALMEVPEVNIQLHGDEIYRFQHADVGIAVATDKGLLVPVIRSADMLSIEELSDKSLTLIEAAREGRLKHADYEGGSFTLSNLGSFGVEQFDAIINPPQCAILAVGSASSTPVADDGNLRAVPTIHLSLSCDHRAIDGAHGARFLAALAKLIEHPEAL